jgi:diguanylate cyclase (GGDEF)-like protein
MDVLTSAGLFRVPIILEYDELKVLQVNAVTDPLTGLYNRRLFGEGFEKELNRARRYGLPLGLVMLDLHRFKEVNDKHGHPAGDEVLRAAAATLKKALRTSDSAFRIGGDEFAVLLPQTDAEQALALSRRIETVFAETLQSLPLSVNVNMDHGVATFPQDGEQADQLIRVADERLYRLKHANHRKLGNGGAKPAPAASPALGPATTTATSAPPEPPATAVAPTERNGTTAYFDRISPHARKARIHDGGRRFGQRRGNFVEPADASAFATGLRHAAQGGTRIHDRNECVRHAGRSKHASCSRH